MPKYWLLLHNFDLVGHNSKHPQPMTWVWGRGYLRDWQVGVMTHFSFKGIKHSSNTFMLIIVERKWSSYRFFMTSTTPRKMMTKSRMPAMTPAIFTVWSVCFSGSTASGFRVAAPATGSPDNHCWNHHCDWMKTQQTDIMWHRHSAAGSEWNKIFLSVNRSVLVNNVILASVHLKKRKRLCKISTETQTAQMILIIMNLRRNMNHEWSDLL